MNRTHKLLLLLLVFAVLCGSTAALSLWNGEPESPAEESACIFSLEPEDVTTITWEYRDTLTFDRGDSGWVYRENTAFPLDESHMDTILEALSRIESEKTIENIENWDTYGLQIPVCTISVTAGETYDLAIGSETPMGGQRYFSIGDGKVYLVDDAILEPFQYDLYDLIAAQVMPEVTQVTAMEVTTPEGSYTLTYEPGSGKAYSDSYVWFWDDQPLDTDLAQELTGLVTNLNLAQCIDYDAKDLDSFGLAAPEIQVTIFDNGTEAYTLDISSVTDDGCYVRLPGTNMVYRTLATVNETLRYTTAADLLPRDVLLMDWETVDSVTATLDGAQYTFLPAMAEIEESEEPQLIWTLAGEETNLADLLNQITSLSANGYATGLTAAGTSLLHLDILRETETYPQVSLAFHSYSSESCIVTLNGETTVTVSREKVASLVDSFRELVEK